MRKSGGEIERDLYDLIKSEVETMLSGKLYRKGLRPKDSVLEDAVLSFMTGITEQVQTGLLNLNVYVKNITLGDVPVCNVPRCTEIEAALSSIVFEAVSSEYELSLGSTIQTFEEPLINQHFVNCKIKFKRIIL